MYENTKLRCKLDFKNIWITSDGKISTVGKCECKSHADISYHNNHLSVKVENISRTFPHKRTYQIRGDFKQKLLHNLEHKSAHAAQTKLINELNPDNEKLDEQFNPFVPNLNAIRLLKSKGHKKEADPVDVLLEWKDTIYENVISAIGHSPFFIFYRSPLQNQRRDQFPSVLTQQAH